MQSTGIEIVLNDERPIITIIFTYYSQVCGLTQANGTSVAIRAYTRYGVGRAGVCEQYCPIEPEMELECFSMHTNCVYGNADDNRRSHRTTGP